MLECEFNGYLGSQLEDGKPIRETRVGTIHKLNIVETDKICGTKFAGICLNTCTELVVSRDWGM